MINFFVLTFFSWDFTILTIRAQEVSFCRCCCCWFFRICYIENSVTWKQIVLFFLISTFKSFIYFPCLIAFAKISRMMLNRNDEKEYSCCFPNLRGKASTFSMLNMMISVAFFECCLSNWWSYFTSILVWGKFLLWIDLGFGQTTFLCQSIGLCNFLLH